MRERGFFSLEDTKGMSFDKVTIELAKHSLKLVEIGMDKEEACNFVNDVMNLSIAANEKCPKEHRHLKHICH